MQKLFTAIGLATVVVVGGGAQAADLNLSKEPLFLTAPVEPNIFIVLDDSGSMDLEIMAVDDAGGSGRGRDSGNDPVGYIFSNASNAYTGGFGRHVDDDEVDSGHGYWRFKDSSYNLLYYDPTVTYEPWPGYHDYRDDTSWTAVTLDPEYPARGTLDLESTSPYRVAKYYTWNDADDDGNRDANEGVQVNIDHSDQAAMGNFANWFAYYRKRSYSSWNAIGRVIARDRSSFRSSILRFRNFWRHNDTANAGKKVYDLAVASDKAALLEELFCKSLTYCSSTGGTPARIAVKTLGEYFADANGPILPEASGGKCQQNFNITVTDGYWNGNSPSVGNTDGPAPDGDADPWDGGLFADGHENTLADVAMEYYETDLKSTYQDKVPISDDVIFAARAAACQDGTSTDCPPYMHQHLVTYTVAFGVQGTLDPTVPPDDDDFPGWPQPSADNPTTVDDLWHAAYNGRGGFLSARKPEQLNQKLDDALNEIDATTSSSSSVALNTGSLTSDTLLFQARFDSGSWSGQLLARSVVASGDDIGEVDLQPLWDAGCTITGLPSGEACLPGDRVDTVRTSYPGQSPDSRNIITYDPVSGAGVPFRLANLDTAQVDALDDDPDTTTVDDDSRAADRVAYLRGQTSDGGGITVSDMRVRARILGDIISSNPVFVGKPSFGYPDSLEAQPYSAFVEDNEDRTPIVYFGANDGMLHGIDATKDANVNAGSAKGGYERLAYVPSSVYGNLSKLTSKDYGRDLGHIPFVDGPPTAGDVFFSNSWKTVLVGGLGGGGKGVFALDITDPSDFSESNASSLVLWEFTDADDTDLGFTYPQPAIVRMQNGKWAAIVSNGYNAAGGEAVVFVLDIEDGSVIAKFDTNTGPTDDPLGESRPNGMAVASPIDLDGDKIIDVIYAGDLFGNVWKMDVSSSSAGSWGFSFGSSTNPAPFFVAKNGAGQAQPITSKIEVSLHPTLQGQIINFGTGKYLEVGDNQAANQPTQVFFGVWDRNETTASVITRAYLLQQDIVEEKLFPNSTIGVRVSTKKAVVWHEGTGLPALPTDDDDPRLGWYMDLVNTQYSPLDNKGERVVSDPVLRDGKIIFVTVLPNQDPCDFGGDSWLMEIDAATGSRLRETPFDLNGDGLFDYNDYVSYQGSDVPVSGIKSGVGIMPSPGILKDNEYSDKGKGREFKYFSGTSGEIQRVSESRGTGFFGRQSWREIFDQ